MRPIETIAQPSRPTVTRRARRRGFRPIEVLIVVLVLGIVSGIGVPRTSPASPAARNKSLKEDLRFLRTEIAVFRSQHRDVCPGYPNGDVSDTPDAFTFISQMTMFTDSSCAVSGLPLPQFPFGPYLSQLPPNALTGLSDVWVVTGPSMPAPDLALPFGWIYNPQLQRVIANAEGVDEDGVFYSDY